MTIDHPCNDSPLSSETPSLRPWTLGILLWLLERKFKRKVRSDKGIMRHTQRDQWAMRWVGTQAGVRFDHFRELLGHYPQDADASSRTLSENATRQSSSGGAIRDTPGLNLSWLENRPGCG